jgi:hypothetical protein
MSPFVPDDRIGAGFTLPSGLVLTHVDATYTTQPVSSGSEAFLEIGYGTNLLVDGLMGDANVGTHLSASVPNATDFCMRVFCSTSASTGCTFPSAFFLSPGALTLTLRDKGRPSVQATGGSLTAAGTYKGQQSLSTPPRTPRRASITSPSPSLTCTPSPDRSPSAATASPWPRRCSRRSLLAQPGLLHLAHVVARQLVEEVDVARALMGRELAGDMIDEL